MNYDNVNIACTKPNDANKPHLVLRLMLLNDNIVDRINLQSIIMADYLWQDANTFTDSRPVVIRRTEDHYYHTESHYSRVKIEVVSQGRNLS